MRSCKYCNKPIAEKDIWNPDIDGNGYHHQCLVDMEFKARDKQIYDKGKMDVLDKIRAEINQYGSIWVQYTIKGHTDRDIEGIIEEVLRQAKLQVLDVIEKYRGEVSS